MCSGCATHGEWRLHPVDPGMSTHLNQVSLPRNVFGMCHPRELETCKTITPVRFVGTEEKNEKKLTPSKVDDAAPGSPSDWCKKDAEEWDEGEWWSCQLGRQSKLLPVRRFVYLFVCQSFTAWWVLAVCVIFRIFTSRKLVENAIPNHDIRTKSIHDFHYLWPERAMQRVHGNIPAGNGLPDELLRRSRFFS